MTLGASKQAPPSRHENARKGGEPDRAASHCSASAEPGATGTAQTKPRYPASLSVRTSFLIIRSSQSESLFPKLNIVGPARPAALGPLWLQPLISGSSIA